MGAPHVGLLAALVLAGHGLAQGSSVWRIEAAVAPIGRHGGIEAAAERPGGDAAADDAHRIGDWTLLDGNRLTTRAGDGALIVACTPGGNGYSIEVVLEGPAAPYELRFEAEAAAPWVAAGSPTAGGAIGLLDADEDRLLALLLARHDDLTVTLTPRAADGVALTLRLTTAGFETAYPWLGCGVSDTCPMRGCGR